MDNVRPSRLHVLVVRRFTWLRKLAELQNCVETLNGQGDFEGGLEAMPRLLQMESLVNQLDQKVWAELERVTYGDSSRDHAADEGIPASRLPRGGDERQLD